MTLRYLSVCSGIEAATVAWHPLGWVPAGFAEIEAVPSAVLAHHYGSNLPGELLSRNGVPNFGDFTTIEAPASGPIDLLVGGTPCQDFSVAGLGAGLSGERGNLTLEFLRLAGRLWPRWLVWENVPGVLSNDGGRAFGAILGGLAKLGYGFAWRVLDAQFVRVDGFARAIPQRRRRVFVVGYLGDWRRAAAVLFERACLSGDPAPRRSAGEDVARPIAAGSPRGSGYRNDADTAENLIAFGGNDTRGPIDVSTALNAHGGPAGRMDFESETFVAHALRGEGFDASEDGTGRGTPIVPIAFDCKAGGDTNFAVGDIAGTLRGEGFGGGHAAIAFDLRGREGGSQFEGPHDTANIRAASGGSSRSYIAQSWAVRRLTPLECERLQGFEDGYTDVPFREKAAADGPRYKALGNSMAVNVMRWIGRRIEMVEALGLPEAA